MLSKRTGPPSTTFPSLLTRIRSEALSSGQATPNGFTQKEVGSTGSCFPKYTLVSCYTILLQIRRRKTYPQSNMSRNPLIKPQLGKNPKCQCQSSFLVRPLLILIRKRWSAWELQPLDLALLLREPWLKGDFGGSVVPVCGH